MLQSQRWTERAATSGEFFVKRASLVGFVLILASCSNTSILEPAGPVADANRTILLNALAIMLAIVVPTMIATLAFAWWFREGNRKARYQPKFVYSGRIELIVWSIPILTIMFLSGVIWIGSHQLDPHRPIASRIPPLEVQVVALDWKWLFIYPQQGIASVNVLPLPIGVPVHFHLTSASVMNAFFVPRLGSQIYVMNGMATELWLQADRPGSYYGRSSHFSGDGFPDMSFRAVAVPPQQFAAWAARVRGDRRMLNERTYPSLAEQSRNVRPFVIGSVQTDIFDAIVTRRLLPASGPDKGRGGPAIKPSGG